MSIVCGDALHLPLPDASVHAVVTDPPYGLKFMGKDWDHGVPGMRFWQEVLRVAKPGAMLLAFGGTRTHHRLMCAIEDAGWEMRDCLMWLQGQGFPKSYNIGQATQKRLTTGHDRRPDRDLGGRTRNRWSGDAEGGLIANTGGQIAVTEPSAKKWQGYGTALKPAWEPIILAMKPVDGTFAENALKHGVAVLNIGGGRIAWRDDSDERETKQKSRHADFNSGLRHNRIFGADHRPRADSGNYDEPGRWPANVVLSHTVECRQVGKRWDCVPGCPVRMLDEQAGDRGGAYGGRGASRMLALRGMPEVFGGYGDSGGASRFFYCAKASRAERDAGLSQWPETDAQKWNEGGIKARRAATGQGRMRNVHPTVKPIDLMRWLVRLVSPPSGGIVFDPFAGSGSTGCACALEGVRFVGVEIDAETCRIAHARIAHWGAQGDLFARSASTSSSNDNEGEA